MRTAVRALVAMGLAAAAACAPLAPQITPVAPRPPTAIDDGDLVALVPAPIEGVLSVDMACLRGSPWARPVLAAATPEERSARALERGFDQVDDVDAWVVAKAPGQGGGDGQAATLELYRGRFDFARLRRIFNARHPGATESAVAGTPVLGAADESLAFLTARTVAFGAPSVVRGVVEAGWRRGRSARDEAWIDRVLGSLDDEAGRRSSSMALELAYQPPADVRTEAGLALGSGGDAVERLGGRLFLGESARLVMVAAASDKYAAGMLAQALAGGARALKARRSVAALGLRRVLDNLRLSARGARVVGELSVSAEDRDLVSQKMALLAELLGKNQPTPAAP
jgi:hypothetical protein